MSGSVVRRLVERIDQIVELLALVVLLLGDRRNTPRELGVTFADQPVAQHLGGAHVVHVVGGDAGEDFAVVVVHPPVVLHHCAGALVDVVAALVLGEPFDRLQSVRLHTRLHRVAYDRQQVDEQARVDKLLQQRLVGAVLGRHRF